jgi:hypothetical protein
MAAVRDHEKRPPSVQRQVLFSLALRMDWHTGQGFASTGQLAADAGVDDRTVRRATGWARSSVMLIQTRRGHRLGDGRTAASEWRLVMPQPDRGDLLSGAASTGQPETSTGQSAHLNRTEEASQPDTTTPPSRPVPSKPLSISPRARDAILAAVPDATETEIDAYAAKIGKTHAPGNLGGYLERFPPDQIAEAIGRMRAPGGFAPSRQPAEAKSADMLLGVDTNVTPEEVAEVLAILVERGARKPVSVLRAETGRGNGYKLLGEARHRLSRADVAALDPPAAADVAAAAIRDAYPREDSLEPVAAGEGFASFKATLAAMKRTTSSSSTRTGSRSLTSRAVLCSPPKGTRSDSRCPRCRRVPYRKGRPKWRWVTTKARTRVRAITTPKARTRVRAIIQRSQNRATNRLKGRTLTCQRSHQGATPSPQSPLKKTPLISRPPPWR